MMDLAFRGAACLALLMPAGGRAELKAVSARLLAEAERASVMVLVRNTTAAPVTVRDLRLGGRPIAEQAAWDYNRDHKLGRGVDWWLVRPRVVPAGGAAAIFLGHVVRGLREPKLALEAVTDGGTFELPCPAPKVEPLRVAAVAFDRDLAGLRLMVRNDTDANVAVESVELNGRQVPVDVVGSPIPPRMLAIVKLAPPRPMKLGEDCTVLLAGDGGKRATAWFRAHPAEALTYMFYGRHCDARDLAAKHIDVPVTHKEAGAEVAKEMDRSGGKLTGPIARRMAERARSFGRDPAAWAWYMQDDAAYGRPRPQSLLDLGRFLREHGSPQLQTLCNPADAARYAWTHDQYLNYSYLCTGRGRDPTVFGGGRSIGGLLSLNAPAPVIYLVDAVGQRTRWITPAELEMASYAALGRGARHVGWFLGPSLWEQGGELRGGIDPLDNRPWRYQEGATACPVVGETIGRIARAFHVLAPYLAFSAKLPARPIRRDTEVLPLLCGRDLAVAVVLNRRVRSVYPRDGRPGEGSGGVRLEPGPRCYIQHALPPWFAARRVLAFDHDRGVRKLAFRSSKGFVCAALDALTTATLVLSCRTEELAEKLQAELAALPRAPGGSPLRPDAVFRPGAMAGGKWHDRNAGYRAAVAVPAAAREGTWLRAELPVEADRAYEPTGTFDANSVRVFCGDVEAASRVDYARALYRPAAGVAGWRTDDPNVRIEPCAAGVRITSTHRRGYGIVHADFRLDANYDVLEIQHDLDGPIAPILAYSRLAAGGRQDAGLNLRAHLTRAEVWREAETLGPAQPGELSLSRVRWVDCIRGAEAKRGRRAGGAATLRLQVYDGTYRFGGIRQVRRRPAVYFRIPAGKPPQKVLAYWDYVERPTSAGVLADDARPANPLPAAAGPAEGAGVAHVECRITDQAVERLNVRAQGAGGRGWIEMRDSAGTLLAWRRMSSQEGGMRHFGRPPVPPGTAHIRAWLTGHGRVLAVDLREPAGARLKPVARVGGQVETLAAAPDGSWLLVGADKVYALAADGTQRWAVDLGTNRRQQDRFGPGRNVEKVAIRPDGLAALAFTFRFDPRTRQYGGGTVLALAPNGRTVRKETCAWNAPPRFGADGAIRFQRGPAGGKPVAMRLDPVSGTVSAAEAAPPSERRAGPYALRTSGRPPRTGTVLWDGKPIFQLTFPPYPLHVMLRPTGQVAAATTQGVIQLHDAAGKVAWRIRRPGRIDDAVLLEGPSLLAIAYKRYPHRWDWLAVPVVELIALADGSSKGAFEGEPADDFGNFGTDLRLAADRSGRIVYVGDQAGRLYCLDVPSRRPKR